MKLLTAVICMHGTSTTVGQNVEYIPLAGSYDYLAVKNVIIKTTKVIEYGDPKEWHGDGLHAGLEMFGITLFTCKEIPDEVVIPENPRLIYEVSDLEGNVVMHAEQDLTETFRMLQFTSSYSTSPTHGFTILRGGEYKFKAEITPDLYTFETKVTLPDEPGMQIADNSTIVGASLQPKMTFTSGYPYEVADFVGQKHLHWTFATANDPTTAIVERDEVFELKSNTPTLAAMDSLRLDAGDNIEPGKYIYTLVSDFAPANYQFNAFVKDTFKPEISLDRNTYKVGESTEAVVTLDMNYRYPYVGSKDGFAEPTVTVSAKLLEETTSKDYSDPAWADSDMHYTATLKIPLDKVTAKVVNEYEDGKIPLEIVVKFNGAQKYETTLNLTFDTDDSGVGNVIIDNAAKPVVKYYNVFGVEVGESYHGIVITSDGRKIIR